MTIDSNEATLDSRERDSELQRAEERLRLALASAEIGTWDWDLIENKIYTDGRCNEVFGFPTDYQPQYGEFFSRIHPEDAERTRQAIDRAMDPHGNGKYEIDYRTVWHDGSLRWVVAKGKAIFDELEGGRRATRFIGTVVDITRRKEAEAAFARAVASRDEVMAIVSHDLRNPLTAVKMAADLMLMQNSSEEMPLRAIRDAVDRAESLIRDLLDVARIDGGVFVIQTERWPATSLVRETLRTVEAHAAARQIELVVATSEEVEVRADRARFAQLLANLLENAIKFTPAGGRVTVGFSPLDERGRFFVSDTGSGIDPQLLPHVFDRFRQGRNRNEGAGLGLAIAKGIVELHGGEIWVESKLGFGTTFYFTLPRG